MMHRQPVRSCELWLIDAAASSAALEALEREVPRLSSDDRRRFAAVKDEKRRRVRRAAGIALRVLIERHFGAAARGIRFHRSGGGKPALPAALGQMSFSVAYAGHYALIGLAGKDAIGVDLEGERRLRLSAQRRQAIKAIGAGLGESGADDDTDAAVLRAWVRIEAFAKACGTGVGRLLEEAGVRDGDIGARGAERARKLARAAGLSTHDILPGHSLFAAVCAPRGARIGRLQAFPATRQAIAALGITGGRRADVRTS